MPTYDYECEACSHEFEHFQSMSDAHLKKCPACGKNKLRRLLGAGGAVMFKGSGFYQTDYRSDSYKKRAAEDNKSGTKGDSKSEGNSASKSNSESGGSSTTAAKE